MGDFEANWGVVYKNVEFEFLPTIDDGRLRDRVARRQEPIPLRQLLPVGGFDFLDCGESVHVFICTPIAASGKPYLDSTKPWVIEHATQAEALFQQVLAAGLNAELI